MAGFSEFAYCFFPFWKCFGERTELTGIDILTDNQDVFCAICASYGYDVLGTLNILIMLLLGRIDARGAVGGVYDCV